LARLLDVLSSNCPSNFIVRVNLERRLLYIVVSHNPAQTLSVYYLWQLEFM